VRILAGLLLVGGLAAATALASPLPPKLAALYAYDAGRPLDVREVGTQMRSGDVTVHDLTFASPKRGRVPAYLVLPPGKGPFPAVVMEPGSNGNRDFVVEDLVDLAKRGVAGFAITPPQMRPDGPLPFRCVAGKDRATFIHYVVEVRRAIDLLVTRPEIDPARIAYSGFSLGSQVGAVLSAVDDRARAIVLQSGTGRATAYAPLLCWRLSKPKLAAYIRGMADLDAIRYVGHAAPTPLLIQNGRRDTIGVAAIRPLHAAASRPKNVQWFPTGHELNVRARTLRDDWLVARLQARKPSLVSAPAVEPCVGTSARRGAVRFKSADGVALAGVVLGSGTTGVVLGHEKGANLCNWLPFARVLAASGYRVLAFDHRSYGESQFVDYPRNLRIDNDVIAAVGELRKRGSRRFVLMGASMGGTAALVAAPALGRSVAAVVDLSGPAQYVRLDAAAAVKRLSAPGLFAVGRFDSGFVADTRALRAASRSPASRLVIRESGAHGTALLEDRAFRALVLGFVERHAR
jgi:pimeloyl-ACP methyl ester carboxylesterase